MLTEPAPKLSNNRPVTVAVCAAVLLAGLTSGAAAQTTHLSDDRARPTTVQTNTGEAACRPRSLKGRYRLYLASPTIFCTLELTASGRVRPQDKRRTMCRGPGLGFKAIIGGRLIATAPLANRHTKTNQCWLSGTIRLARGLRIEIFEGFVVIGKAGFTGMAIDPRGLGSFFTAIRY